MKILQLLSSLMTALFLLLGCGPNPTPIVEVTPIPSGVEIVAIKEEKNSTSELTQQKTFDQCDSASGFKAEVQFSQSSGQESQEELVLKASVGGEGNTSGDLLPNIKVKIEGAIEQHYASSKSNSQGHQEGVSIEVQPHTKQVYSLIWRQTRRTGIIEYVENGETKTASYDYRIGLELLSAIGKDLPCPDKKDQGETIQEPPTPNVEDKIVEVDIPTSTDTPTVTIASTPVGIIAGVWSGQAKNGDYVFDISVTLTKPCEIGSVCGSFNIPVIPCAGTFTLLNVQDKRFQFEAGDFQGTCEPGAEDYLEFLSDGTLLYLSRGSYGESKGILQKTGN